MSWNFGGFGIHHRDQNGLHQRPRVVIGTDRAERIKGKVAPSPAAIQPVKLELAQLELGPKEFPGRMLFFVLRITRLVEPL